MLMDKLGDFIMPIFAAFIIIYGLCAKVPVFDGFLSGAAEGLKTSFNIMPALVGLLAAVTMLNSSGALDVITNLLKPIADILGLPQEVVPLALLRPVSGRGSMALVENVLTECGPDSFPGRVASVIQGSTETTFYAVAVYYGSINIKNTRHTIPSALVADLVGMVLSGLTVKLFFGM